MTNNNAAVEIYKSHAEAEVALQELHHSNFDMKKVSIIARDHYADELMVGYNNAKDRKKCWGRQRAFWRGIWGLLFGSAFFWIPGFGPLLVAGPLVTRIVRALKGAVVAGGVSAIGTGLYSLGIPKHSILRYETALKSGKFVVIARGSAAEAAQAWEIINRTKPEALEAHPSAHTSPEACVMEA